MLFRNILVSLILCLTLTACDSAEDKARAHYERGLELLTEGDEARARVEFRNAIKEVNTFVEPRLELARISMKNGAFRPAFVNYLRVAEQMPDNLEARVALAEISFYDRQWAPFEEHASAAARIAPDDAAVAILSTALGYREAAVADDASRRNTLLAQAETQINDAPDSEILRRILIDGYITNQEFTKALREIDRSLEDAPDNIELYRLKVQVLARLGDEDGIEATLRKMVEVDPKDETVMSNLLQYMISRNRLAEAEDFLRARAAAAPEGDETMLVNLVQFQLQLIGVSAAVEELDAAIAKNPNAYTLRSLRASLDYDIGRRAEAIAELQNILEAGDSEMKQGVRENIKVTLATMLSRDGNEVGARRLVEEILNENPNVVGALKIQARWMIAADNTEGAINAMRSALAVEAQDTEAMLIMAEAYQRAGNAALMRDFLSLAVEASGNAPEQSLRYATALRADDNSQQAESILIASLRVQPDNVDVLRMLGSIYIELDDTPRARQVISTLRGIDSEIAATSANEIELELVAKESGNEEALSYLENLAQDSEGNTGVQLTLVRARLQSGDTDGALELINEMAEADPENDSIAYFRAVTLSAAGDFESAKSELTALVERNPRAVPAWQHLLRLQNQDTVLPVLDKALEANPESSTLLWIKASYLQEINDIDGAIDIYEYLYERNSQSVIIANNLASLLATFRRDDESLERARIIARRLKDTDLPAAQDTYGWILHRSGQSEEALPYLESAAQVLTEDATVQYHLGAVYEALERKEEALGQMRKAIDKIGPLGSGALKDEILARITALESADKP